MFNLDALKLNSRRAAAALGALAIGIAFSGSAAAAPLPLFPFVMSPPTQSAPPLQASPSEDEGTVAELPARLKRQVVSYATREAPGTIIIDTPNTYLYLCARRRPGDPLRHRRRPRRLHLVRRADRSPRSPSGRIGLRRADMIARQPYLPRFMAGGPGNPLGARAMYLGGTIYRIHGTNEPSTIGTRVSSGCIRLTNEDVTDLYSRVNVGTKVIVLPMDRRAEAN